MEKEEKRKNNREERDRLVENNLRLINYVIKKYTSQMSREAISKTHDMDDLWQIGSIGLIEAAENYDPKRGMFSTLAILYMKNRLFNAFRANLVKVDGVTKVKTFMYDSINEEREGGLCLETMLGTEDEIDIESRIAKIRKTFENINEETSYKYKDGLEYLLFIALGYTYEEIGTIAGVGKTAVSSQIERCRNIVRHRREDFDFLFQ